MNIRENIRQANLQLQFKSPTPELDTKILLKFVLRKDDIFVLSNPDYLLTADQQTLFNDLIKKRLQNIPMAYLTRQKEFFGLTFQVTPDVLIPRPETELLVEKALSLLQKSSLPSPIIWDIGTGSGCIAVTLAKKYRTLRVMATDISNKALKIAQKNAKIHNVESRIEFIQSDLLSFVSDKTPTPTLIIANLPYLDPAVYQDISIKAEPDLALYSTHQGLFHYTTLLGQIKNSNQSLPKNLLMEVNPEQKKPLANLCQKLFEKCHIECIKDYQNQDRIMNVDFCSKKGGNCEK